MLDHIGVKVCAYGRSKAFYLCAPSATLLSEPGP